MLDIFLVIKETIEPKGKLFLQAPILMLVRILQINMNEPICIFIETYWP